MSTVLLTQVLPVVLGLIMLCVGIRLTPADFYRVFRQPLKISVGLVLQLLGLPLLAVGLMAVFPLPESVAIGIWLLALSPGGATSNAISPLCGGDGALSISMTAISSMVIPVTLPLLLPLALPGAVLAMPFMQTFMQVALVTMVPVILGMGIRRVAGGSRVDGWQSMLEKLSFAGLLLTVLLVIIVNLQVLDQLLSVASAVSLLLCLAGMLLGYLGSRFWPSDKKLPATYMVEVGMQNAGTAIFVATALMNRPEYALTPLLYGILMNLPVVAFICWHRRRLPLASH